MTFNFSMQAIDHVINSAAKAYYMSAGKVRLTKFYLVDSCLMIERSSRLKCPSFFVDRMELLQVWVLNIHKTFQHGTVNALAWRLFHPIRLKIAVVFWKLLSVMTIQVGVLQPSPLVSTWVWWFCSVVFLENELVYGQAFPISDEALSPDFVLPIGKGKIEREGKHISLVSHSIGVKICLEAAKELEQSGIDCEVGSFSIHRSPMANPFSSR